MKDYVLAAWHILRMSCTRCKAAPKNTRGRSPSYLSLRVGRINLPLKLCLLQRENIANLGVREHSPVREKGHEPARGEEVRLHAAGLEVLVQVRQVPHQQAVQLEKPAPSCRGRRRRNEEDEDRGVLIFAAGAGREGGGRFMYRFAAVAVHLPSNPQGRRSDMRIPLFSAMDEPSFTQPADITCGLLFWSSPSLMASRLAVSLSVFGARLTQTRSGRVCRLAHLSLSRGIPGQ